MEKLSLKKKLFVIRLYFEGLSYDEIAAKAGVSKGTVANIITELKAGRFPEFADFLLNVLGLEQTLAGITKKKAGVKKRSSKVAKKDTEALMRKRPDVRELEAKEDTKGLIKALEDERKKVREAAARALGRIVDKRAVEPLMQILEDESEKVREAAVRALGKIGDASAVEPLTQALKDRDEGVRRDAAEALGKIGDASAVKPLIQTLKDKSSMVRKAAVRALKRFSTERTREAIEEYEEREREAERKRKVKAKELQLVCQKCRHKFILGRNALVVTPEDVLKAFRGPKIFFADGTLRTSGDSIPGNMRFKSPDLVDSCNYSTLELRVVRKQKTEVNGILSALSRGEPRMWICRKCNTTQPYP